MLSATLVTIAAVGLHPAPAPAGQGSAAPSASDVRPGTQWAYVERRAWVRARPRLGARRLARLRTTTFLGSPETVLVLRRRVAPDGSEWSRVRYPGLGRRVGWMRDIALSPTFVATGRVVVDRRRFTLRVRRKGKVVMRARIGVGAHGSPTPAGRTYVRERVVPRSRGGIYGVLAFGLGAFSPWRTDWPGGGQVGIHGTNQPGLIPGRISNGCIRLRNRAVRRFDRLVEVGTPVLVK